MTRIISGLLACLLSLQSVWGQYDKVDPAREGMSKVTKGKKYGFVNTSGKLVVPLEYDAANGFYEGVSAVKKNGKVGYIDKNHNLVIPIIFDGGYNFSKGYAVVGADKKLWMIDKRGRQATPRKYDLLKFDGDYAMMVLDKKWGYVNSQGKEIIPPEYDYIHNLREGLIGAKKGQLWGFIDTTDRVVLPFEYERVNIFIDGTAIVTKNGKTGTIDKNGKTVVPFNYQTLYTDDATGWYQAEKKDKWGMIDRRGKEMIAFDFDDIDDFSEVNEGYAIVEIKGKSGMIDQKGKMVIPARYDKIFECEDGYCGVQNNKKYGLVELASGREAIAPQYDGIGNLHEGFSIIRKIIPGVYASTSKYGYVSVSGKEITSMKYEEAENFSDGMAAIKLDGKWGFIDITGKEVIFPRYSSVTNFSNGVATVVQDGQKLTIDKKGRIVESKQVGATEKKPGSTLGMEDEGFESLLSSISELANGPNGKFYLLTGNTPGNNQQTVMSASSFPHDAISEKWKQGYHITDISLSDSNEPDWIMTMTKNKYNWQSYRLRPSLDSVISEIKKGYATPQTYVTHLSWQQNQWVLVLSRGSGELTGQKVLQSPAGTTNFPVDKVKEANEQGYAISSLAYGKGGWAVVVSKTEPKPQQWLVTANAFDEANLAAKNKDGYYLTDAAKDSQKYYLLYTKMPDDTHQQEQVFLFISTLMKSKLEEGTTLQKLVRVPPAESR